MDFRFSCAAIVASLVIIIGAFIIVVSMILGPTKMNKKIQHHCFLVWMSVLIATTDRVSSQNVQSAIREFTNTILQQTESTTRSNFVLSPFSIHSAFSMVLLGSGGQTKSQLEGVLGFNRNFNVAGTRSNDGYSGLNRRLLDQINLVEGDMKIVNKMYVAQGFSPKPSYTRVIESAFHTSPEPKNFGRERARSVREINDFVSRTTSNKIEDLVSEDDVDSLTRMILINAIYFKAPWKRAFAPEETFRGFFRSSSAEVNYTNIYR
jgi:serine protease inhibitor